MKLHPLMHVISAACQMKIEMRQSFFSQIESLDRNERKKEGAGGNQSRVQIMIILANREDSYTCLTFS